MKKQVQKHNIKPFNFTSVITNEWGRTIQVQGIQKEGETYTVIYEGDKTTVILEDGCKGVANRNPEDPYDIQVAHDIAHSRAKIKSLKKKINKIYKEGKTDTRAQWRV